MSHTDGNTFGLEHGKIGDRIAVVLDGKQIYKKLYKPTNPRTPKQQMHRAKLAFVNRLSKELAEAVNLGFEMVPEKGSGQTIDIYEREDEGNPQANCMCDVDNEFDLYSIELGIYTLVFHSCYPDTLSATFSF